MKAKGRWIDVVAAGTVGMLLGFLVGMSVSPVVGGVVAAVLALGTGFSKAVALRSDRGAGKAAEGDQPAGPATLFDAWTVAFFALFTLLGAAGGLYCRTHDIFAKRVSDGVGRWSEGKFSEHDAQALYLYEQFGRVPPGVMGLPISGGEKNGTGITPRNDQHSGLYFYNLDACTMLFRVPYPSDKAALEDFESFGKEWSSAASFVRARHSNSEGEARQWLLMVKEFVCATQPTVSR